MTRTSSLAALALFTASFVSGAHAGEPKKPEVPRAAPAKNANSAKADPSGTWTWTFNAPNGNSFQRTVKLSFADGKLTGTTTGRDGAEHPIQDGAFKDGTVTFAVVRERDGQKFTSKFQGKVDGDAIKGTMTMNRDGEAREMPWEAKRTK
jgi:hypothetical protein